jgi:hypothetical protein
MNETTMKMETKTIIRKSTLAGCVDCWFVALSHNVDRKTIIKNYLCTRITGLQIVLG